MDIVCIIKKPIISPGRQYLVNGTMAYWKDIIIHSLKVQSPYMYMSIRNKRDIVYEVGRTKNHLWKPSPIIIACFLFNEDNLEWQRLLYTECIVVVGLYCCWSWLILLPFNLTMTPWLNWDQPGPFTPQSVCALSRANK